MAVSPNSTILSRRTLMASAPGAALAALSIPATSATSRKFETDGYIPADDMLPQHREVRVVVEEIERWGHQVVLCAAAAGIAINYGHGRPREPLDLWSRFNALDRPLLVEWLQLSGRTNPKIQTHVPGVLS
jgi:hypothetical protein